MENGCGRLHAEPRAVCIGDLHKITTKMASIFLRFDIVLVVVYCCCAVQPLFRAVMLVAVAFGRAETIVFRLVAVLLRNMRTPKRGRKGISPLRSTASFIFTPPDALIVSSAPIRIIHWRYTAAIVT